jgi:uncharacterized membrane protein (UPF0136 family)
MIAWSNDFMIAQTVLWTYIVMLVVGGVIGMVKGRSLVSLVMSVAFAVPLSLCALRVLSSNWTPWLLLALMIVFAVRLGKTRKFMPAGLMLILTVLALALPHLPFR